MIRGQLKKRSAYGLRMKGDCVKVLLTSVRCINDHSRRHIGKAIDGAEWLPNRLLKRYRRLATQRGHRGCRGHRSCRGHRGDRKRRPCAANPPEVGMDIAPAPSWMNKTFRLRSCLEYDHFVHMVEIFPPVLERDEYTSSFCERSTLV